MLREQLIRQHVFFSSENHDHDVKWKSRDVIQRETQRIAEDLFTSSPDPSLSPRRRSRSPLERSLSPKRPDVTHVKSWPASRDPSPSSRRTRSPRRSLSPAQPDVTQVTSWSPSSSHLQPRSPGHRFRLPRRALQPGRLGVPPLSPIRSRSPELVSGSNNIAQTQSWSPSVSHREDPLIISPIRKEETFHSRNLTLDEALFPPLSPNLQSPEDSPGLSPSKSHNSRSPNEAVEDNDRYESFSEIWDSPVKKVDVALQRTIPEDLEVSVGFDSSPRHGLELQPFDEKGDASQWADLSTDIHSKSSNVTPPGAPPKDSPMLDPPEGSPCSIRTFPTSPEKSQVSELSVKTPLADIIPPIPPSPSDTTVTYMGRNRNLKTKTITYLVEPYDMDDDEETYDFVETDYDDPGLLAMDGYSTDDDSSWEDEPTRRRAPTPAKASMLRLSSTSSSSLFDQVEEDKRPVTPSLFDETEDEEEDQTSSKSSFVEESADKINKTRRYVEDHDRSEEEYHDRVHKADMEKENVSSEKRQGPPGNRQEYRKNKQLEKAVSLALSHTSVEVFEPVVDKSTRKLPNMPSPLSSDYSILLNDPAYLHAQKAGLLWQSLVGQHVRFPSRWWNGARSPPLGAESSDSSKWQYAGRFPIKGQKNLQSIVRNRGSQGRILLHIIVQDLVTRKPIQDIAIGCFHPNARGIRQTSTTDRSIEDSRDVWLAIRKRCDYNVSVLDHLLLKHNENGANDEGEKNAKSSPLGVSQRVTNQNMRVVFGDQPPMETIFRPESELFERLSKKKHLQVCPAMLLLEAYVFRTVLLK